MFEAQDISANSTGFRQDVRTYLVGFFSALVLTGAAFWVVLNIGTVDPKGALAWVALLGVTQLIVHLRCFLHINTDRKNREELDLILFTTLVLLIIVLGTGWVMTDLASRMHVMGG